MGAIGGSELSRGLSGEGGEAGRQESPDEETDRRQRGTVLEWIRKATEAA